MHDVCAVILCDRPIGHATHCVVPSLTILLLRYLPGLHCVHDNDEAPSSPSIQTQAAILSSPTMTVVELIGHDTHAIEPIFD